MSIYFVPLFPRNFNINQVANPPPAIIPVMMATTITIFFVDFFTFADDDEDPEDDEDEEEEDEDDEEDDEDEEEPPVFPGVIPPCSGLLVMSGMRETASNSMLHIFFPLANKKYPP